MWVATAPMLSSLSWNLSSVPRGIHHNNYVFGTEILLLAIQ